MNALPDSVVFALIILAGMVLAHLWTRHCRRQAEQDPRPDQRIQSNIVPFEQYLKRREKQGRAA